MKEALEKIDARGGTALYDAVVASAEHLKHNARLEKKVLFVVTDGEDNASNETLEQAVKQLQEENTNANAPRDRPWCRSSSRVSVQECDASSRASCEVVQDGPSEHIRQENVERNRRRVVLLRQRQSLGPGHGTQDLEALVAGQVTQDAGIVRIVFDDQKDRVPFSEVVAIVFNPGFLFDRRHGSDKDRHSCLRAALGISSARESG